uniref:Uncharacterized protein n=1 Tax=Trypanosoma vivax (strain Y486) TaxID=1055687 RepID=G0U8G5_TRYVY|nr:hypothetical protein TVY486_1113750 [Trypanosoma vivax Y486]
MGVRLKRRNIRSNDRNSPTERSLGIFTPVAVQHMRAFVVRPMQSNVSVVLQKTMSLRPSYQLLICESRGHFPVALHGSGPCLKCISHQNECAESTHAMNSSHVVCRWVYKTVPHVNDQTTITCCKNSTARRASLL